MNGLKKHARGRAPIDLPDQLAEAGFPSGAGVGSLTGFVLLLFITAFTALYLVTTGPLSLFGPTPPSKAVPGGVAELQRRTTTSLAQAVATAVTGNTGELRVAVSSGVLDTADTPTVVRTLSKAYPAWRSIAVVDTRTRKALAQYGDPMPYQGLLGGSGGNVTVQAVARADGLTMVLTAAPLSGSRAGQLLVAATAMRAVSAQLDADQHQNLRLVTAGGKVLETHGDEPAKDDPGTRGLVSQAVSAAAAGQDGVLIGPTQGTIAPVVSYAPVTAGDIAGSLGLSLVSVSQVPLEPLPARYPGLLPAAALLVLAAGSTFLLRKVVVTPIRQLRADALAVASHRLDDVVRRSRTSEVRQAAKALEVVRIRLRHGKPLVRRQNRGVSAHLVVALVSLALLGWSATVALTLGMHGTAISPTLVSNHDLRVTHSADTVQRSLDQGLYELREVARLGEGKTPGRLSTMLGELTAGKTRFRSVYLTDANGKVTLNSGRDPFRDQRTLPNGEGIRQDNTSGRLPVVFAYEGMPDGQTLIGEFDVTWMATLLKPAGGRVRLVDDGYRTIADTQGYLAFAVLPEGPARDEVALALAGDDAKETTDSAVIGAHGLTDPGGAANLHWAVVAEQPINALDAAGTAERDGGRVAALLTAVVAILLYGWHFLLVLRPLRRVALAAQAIADGDLTSVGYPQRQDEIGTIASCLELCRRALLGQDVPADSTRLPCLIGTDNEV